TQHFQLILLLGQPRQQGRGTLLPFARLLMLPARPAQPEQERQRYGQHQQDQGHAAPALATRIAEAYLPPWRHGSRAACESPRRSSRPNRIFMFCTAWPEAPLTRLSITDSTTTRLPPCGRCTAIRQTLPPRTL